MAAHQKSPLGKARDGGMATNKKKIFITQTMSLPGRTLLKERDDIDLVEFPNLISARDFEALLKEHAPVHGVALGATRFGEPELEATRDMKVVTPGSASATTPSMFQH